MGLSNSLSTAVRLPIREVLLRCSSIRLCSDLTPVLSAVYLADRTTSQARQGAAKLGGARSGEVRRGKGYNVAVCTF